MARVSIDDLEQERQITTEQLKAVFGGSLGAGWTIPDRRKFPDSLFHKKNQQDAVLNKRKFPDSFFMKK